MPQIKLKIDSENDVIEEKYFPFEYFTSINHLVDSDNGLLEDDDLDYFDRESLIIIISRLKKSQLDYMKRYGESKVLIGNAFDLLYDFIEGSSDIDKIKESAKKLIETQTP